MDLPSEIEHETAGLGSCCKVINGQLPSFLCTSRQWLCHL